MPPFAGDAIAPTEQATIEAVAAARASAKNGAEHTGVPSRCTAVGFGQGKAMQIIAQLQGVGQARMQVGADVLPCQGGHIGAQLAATGTVTDAGQGDADALAPHMAGGGVGVGHQGTNGFEEVGVAGVGGVDALAMANLQLRVAGDHLDLAAADIETVIQPVAGGISKHEREYAHPAQPGSRCRRERDYRAASPALRNAAEPSVVARSARAVPTMGRAAWRCLHPAQD